jgi:hypothetical protein
MAIQTFDVRAMIPGKLSPDERAIFQELVLKGDEVYPGGLTKRIEEAKSLISAYSEDRLIGVGALKCPDANYRTKVFAKAGEHCYAASDFLFELGWVYVIQAWRKNGVATGIVGAALAASDGQRIFATSKSRNEPMHKRLAEAGFYLVGKPFPSTRGSYSLVLFVRPT